MTTRFKKVYLMCPVRKVLPEEKIKIDKYVEKLEKVEYKVHYPPRDVDQTQSGMEILSAHRQAILDCDEIHIWWDNNSKGSHFDLGMAFMLCLVYTDHHIKFVIANDVQKTSHKSFENFIIELSMTEKKII